MASPTRRSTGLVNALPVLFTGTSRKHTAPRDTASCVVSVSRSLCCQRMQPRRSRVISLIRRPAKSQVMTKARMSSNLKWVLRLQHRIIIMHVNSVFVSCMSVSSARCGRLCWRSIPKDRELTGVECSVLSDFRQYRMFPVEPLHIAEIILFGASRAYAL
jgi:hypothetical protein